MLATAGCADAERFAGAGVEGHFAFEKEREREREYIAAVCENRAINRTAVSVRLRHYDHLC